MIAQGNVDSNCSPFTVVEELKMTMTMKERLLVRSVWCGKRIEGSKKMEIGAWWKKCGLSTLTWFVKLSNKLLYLDFLMFIMILLCKQTIIHIRKSCITRACSRQN